MWSCSQCTFDNRPSIDRCEVCNAAKPSPLIPASASDVSDASVEFRACDGCGASTSTLKLILCAVCGVICRKCNDNLHRTRGNTVHVREPFAQHDRGQNIPISVECQVCRRSPCACKQSIPSAPAPQPASKDTVLCFRCKKSRPLFVCEECLLLCGPCEAISHASLHTCHHKRFPYVAEPSAPSSAPSVPVQNVSDSLPGHIPPFAIDRFRVDVVNADDEVDVRGLDGKWRPALIVEVSAPMVEIRFVGLDEQFNEWIDCSTDQQRARIALANTLSCARAGDPAMPFEIGQSVLACTPSYSTWQVGTVSQIDKPQVLVNFAGPPPSEYWFHSFNDATCIKPLPAPVESTPKKAANSKTVAIEPVFQSPQPIFQPASVGIFKPAAAIDAAPAVESSDTVITEPLATTYRIGDLVSAFNTRLQDWEPAQVIDSRGSGDSLEVQIRPMTEGTARRDRWLSVVRRAHHLQRFDSYVAQQQQTDQSIVASNLREAHFAEQLASQGLAVRPVGGDGSCLYRSFSLLLFGTESRHAEIRAACFEHMRRHRAYFATFVFDDFDAYVTKNEQKGQWGGEPEIAALAERYNRRVQVLAVPESGVIGSSFPANIDEPSLLTLPLLRLSFHNRGHYNAIVHTDAQLNVPLGDGSNDAVQYLTWRVTNESKPAVPAPVVEEFAIPLSVPGAPAAPNQSDAKPVFQMWKLNETFMRELWHSLYGDLANVSFDALAFAARHAGRVWIQNTLAASNVQLSDFQRQAVFTELDEIVAILREETNQRRQLQRNYRFAALVDMLSVVETQLIEFIEANY